MFAQHEEMCLGKHEKIKAEKVAFITNRLDLTVEEAQNFWPLYNEMENKMKEIKKQHKCSQKDMKEKASAMSDMEMEELLISIMEDKVKMAQIEQEYYLKFKKVIPVKKVWELHVAEKDFTHELLKKLKENKEMKSGPGPRADCYMD